MAYKIESSEDAGEGLRRVLGEQIERAIHRLEQPVLDSEAIYEARKHFKKVRAALRLARDSLGKRFEIENARFRDAGRALSSARDAQSVADTLSRLVAEEQGSGAAFATARAELSRLGEEDTAPQHLRRAADEVVAELQTARAELATWPLGNASFGMIDTGLGRTYRRGRAAFRAAAHPDDEQVHEWRKQVKQLWYQMRLLEAMWPAVLSVYSGELKQLSRLLGDERDLGLLRATLLERSDQFGGAEEVQVLVALIDQRRGELHTQAQLLGRRIYAERPRCFTERFQRYWKSWRPSGSVPSGGENDHRQGRSSARLS